MKRKNRVVFDLIKAFFTFMLKDVFLSREVRFTTRHTIGKQPNVSSRELFSWQQAKDAIYYRLNSNKMPAHLLTLYALIKSRESLTSLAVNVSFNFFVDEKKLRQLIKAHLPNVTIALHPDKIQFYNGAVIIAELRQMLHRLVLMPQITLGRTQNEHAVQPYDDALNIIELILKNNCAITDSRLPVGQTIIRPTQTNLRIPCWVGSQTVFVNRAETLARLQQNFTHPKIGKKIQQLWQKMNEANNEDFVHLYTTKYIKLTL